MVYQWFMSKDGRIAPDDEIIANINPNTWDSVTRIYLCRREEFSFTNTRSRCKITSAYMPCDHVIICIQHIQASHLLETF